MVEGKGGRVGPDLTSVGISRTVDRWWSRSATRASGSRGGLTEPTKEFAQRYETVTVETADGKEIKGVTLNEDSFSLQVMD